MKKLIILLLLATSAQSQIYVSTGIDVRNAVTGTQPTNMNPALDLLFKVHLVGKNVECTVQYERFNTIGFEKYAFGAGYIFPLYGNIGGKTIRTLVIPSIEPTLIGRWKTNNSGDFDSKSSHLALGGSMTVKWELSERLAIGIVGNALYRTDLVAKYNTKSPIVYSNYLTLFYKIN
jgi:hypothetical protein